MAATTLVLAGCGDDDPEPAPATESVLTLGGTDDNGILNYAYLLAQLEAAFYTKVVAAPPADLQPGELAYLTDLRDHELIHREYLKFVLGTNRYDNSLPTPFEFDFSTFTLTTRTGVWTAAQLLEDAGAAAYNGAGKLLTVSTNLVALSKIASVESRHAALAHEMLQSDSFASTVGADGLDSAKTPVEILELLRPYFPVTISAAALPTT